MGKADKIDKAAQLRTVLATNPAPDEYHTWIRDENDILTLSEAIALPDWQGDNFNPDWLRSDALKAIRSGRLTVYASKPIKAGGFVTPSKLEALSYAPDGHIYETAARPSDIAWIDPTQGQYAPVPVGGFGDLNRIRRTTGM